MASNNDASNIATCTARSNALAKYATAKETIELNGETYKPADLEKKYQACIDARQSLIEKRAEVATLMATREAADAERSQIDQGLRGWVTNKFGPQSQAAKEFGFKKERAKPSVETLAIAAAKRKATRQARGIKGKKQRIEQAAAQTAASTASTPAAAAPAASAPSATAATGK